MPAGIFRGRVLFFYKAFNCGHYWSAGFIRGRVLNEEIRYAEFPSIIQKYLRRVDQHLPNIFHAKNELKDVQFYNSY